MTKSDGPRYEVPRAVRLSDARTASSTCYNGTYGTAMVCLDGSVVLSDHVCEAGSRVQCVDGYGI